MIRNESYLCGISSATDFVWDRILTKGFTPDVEKSFREMFSETVYIERRGYTDLQKIVLGLLDRDLESELTHSTAELNMTNSDGRTALSLAAECGQQHALEILLRFHADSSTSSIAGGSTVLHYAACAEDPGGILILLQHGVAVDPQTSWKQTPLIHVAAFRPDARHAELLIASGADVHHVDLDGDNALMWAVLSGNLPVLRVLLHHGARPRVNKHGQSALSKAVELNQHDCIAAILGDLLSVAATPGGRPAGDVGILTTAAQFADPLTLDLLRGMDFSSCEMTGSAAREILKRRGDWCGELCDAFEQLIVADSSDRSGLREEREAENDVDGEITDGEEIWHDAPTVG